MSMSAELGRERTRRWTKRRGTAAVLLVAVALGWWAFLRPSVLGGPMTFVTVTGVSMEPRFHTGDLAVVYERDDYQTGDVIAFRAEAVPGKPGAHVIHRIVGGDAAAGYVTRGDNNDWDDPWRPTLDEVTGELLFSVPSLGSGVRWLAQPIHLAAVLAGLVATLVMFGGKPAAPRIEDGEPVEDVEKKEPVPS